MFRKILNFFTGKKDEVVEKPKAKKAPAKKTTAKKTTAKKPAPRKIKAKKG